MRSGHGVVRLVFGPTHRGSPATTKGRHVSSRQLARTPALVAALLGALLVPLACTGDIASDGAGTDPASSRTSGAAVATDTSTTGTWLDAGAETDEPVASTSLIRGRIDLTEPADELRIDLSHARMVSIPGQCVSSTVTRTMSSIEDADLVCLLEPGVDRVAFTVIALGSSGDAIDAEVTTRRGVDFATSSLPTRTISGGDPRLSPDLRLVSSPDFLNGDIGDLRDGPGFWKKMPREERTTNSINRDYRVGLDRILDDWEALDPAGVLVAGDLVDGRWGYDEQDSGNFGPVDTRAEQRLALRRAARTYYPQWSERFADHGLAVFPAMGDHEYGDNPWPRRKRALAKDFDAEWAREFTTDSSGAPLFADRPEGPARLTAYAGRPTPEVQVVTLDVFDITRERARIKVDRQQLSWLRGVLRKAQRDDVQWTIVQAHVPILGPVRTRASSELSYPRGTRSRLWKVFERFGVDLYLTGEVHDTTAREADGIVQISHGGIFHVGLTTALLLDFYGDRLYVTLRDYHVERSLSEDDERLWETRRDGLPSRIEVVGEPSTIGTATVVDGRLSGASGILVPPSGG